MNSPTASKAAGEGELPPDWLEQDAVGSYYDAIAEIGKRVRAGAPVPEFLLTRRGNSRSDAPGGPA